MILHQNAIRVYDVSMILLGLGGFVFGFVLGMALNGYLLRDIPPEAYTKDKSIRIKYGLLNWSIAIIFMILMLFIGQLNP